MRELAGPDAAAAFVVDDLGSAVKSLDAFLGKLTEKAGASQLAQTRASLKQQFDLDPLDPKSYESWGIDTGRGLIVFTESKETSPILALAVDDEKKLDAALDGLLDDLNK